MRHLLSSSVAFHFPARLLLYWCLSRTGSAGCTLLRAYKQPHGRVHRPNPRQPARNILSLGEDVCQRVNNGLVLRAISGGCHVGGDLAGTIVAGKATASATTQDARSGFIFGLILHIPMKCSWVDSSKVAFRNIAFTSAHQLIKLFYCHRGKGHKGNSCHFRKVNRRLHRLRNAWKVSDKS